MSLEIRVGGVWKTIDTASIKVGGAWKTPDSIEIKVAGVWKTIWPTGPAVSAVNGGDYNFAPSGTCYAGVQFHSNGNEYEANAAGSFTNLIGVWLDAGLNSEVWVEPLVTLNSWNSGPATGARYRLDTTRSWLVSRSVLGSKIVTAHFKFWDAASGGSILQTTGNGTYEAEQGTA